MNKDPDSLLSLAEKAAKSKDFVSAKRFCTEALEENPGDVKSLRFLAFVYSLERDYETAVEKIDAVMRATGNKREPTDYFNKGRWLLEQRNFSEAVLCFSEVLSLCDKYQDSYYQDSGAFYRAIAHAQMRRYDNAVADLDMVSDPQCRIFALGQVFSVNQLTAELKQA